MSKSVQIRRGTSLDHEQFIGASGEITVDTTNWTVRVHTGSLTNPPGGYQLVNAQLNPEITAEEFKANKILYKNSYASLNDFPTASDYPGMLAYAQLESAAYISNGTDWTSFIQQDNLDAAGYVTGSIATGLTGQSLLPPSNKIGTNLVFKTLVGGTNISLSSDNNSITITGPSYTATNVYDSDVNSYKLYKTLVGTDLKFRSIRPGTGLTMSQSVSGDEINIDTILKQAFNTFRVNGVDVTPDQANETLNVNSTAGLTINGSNGTNTLTFGLNLTAVNNTLQTGSGTLHSYSSGNFVFNKVKAGVGISISEGNDGEIVVNAPQIGTVTSGENLGVSGAGGGVAVFESDLSDESTLKFRRIKPGAGITVLMSSDQNYVELSSTLSVPGGAQAGVVGVGDQYRLAFYPLASAASQVGPTDVGVYYDFDNDKLVADVTGQVSDIGNHTTNSLAEGSNNLYWTQTRFNTALANKSTADLAEGGTNLYFTNERAMDAVSTMLLNGNPTPASTIATTTAVVTSIATVTVASTSGITVGMTVTGAGFPVGVTVQAVPTGTTFTVSPAIYAPSGTSITLTGGTTLILNTSANTTSTATLTVNSTSGLNTGWYVTGTGVAGQSVVTTVTAPSTVIVTPGYNITSGSGTALTFSPTTTTGITSANNDGADTHTYRIDPNYLGTLIRNSLSVNTGQGLSYDPVAGRFGLSGAVTSVNGYSGSVVLSVGDISGAAPSASPVLTGTPRVPTPTNVSNILQIANKDYVDATRLAITGAPLSGLATLQALGQAINGDTLFFQTTASAIAAKLSSSGGTMNGSLNLNYTIDSLSNPLVAVNKQYVDLISTVQSVNTKTGNVVLNTDDIFERSSPAPSHLWFTSTRARQAISVTSNDTDILSYNIGTGVITFAKPTTDAIAEGSTNQYWTASRSRGAMGISVAGGTNFASYNSGTGVYSFNASTDNLSQGTTNKFYTDALARAALSYSTSTSQAQLLSYNDQTGQFTVNARTGNITESAGGPYYYTNARVYAAISAGTTQLDNVTAANSFQFNSSTGAFTFNANTNSITEGTTNQYFTQTRARSAISISSTDTTVLDYNSSTGAFTFTKPTTDKISEGSNNLYFTQSRARGSMGVTVTSTTGIANGSHMTYDSATGVYSINANLDSLADGATNKFASITRVAGIISLTTTSTNGATPGSFLSYSSTTGTFTFNNSTDSLAEGTVNKWASDSTVRSKISVNSGTQTALSYDNSTGILSFAPTVNTTNLIYRGTPSGGQFHFDTVQNISSTGKPSFLYVTHTTNPVAANTGTRLAIATGEVTFDCSKGAYHEVNRNGAISTLSFTSTPTNGQFFEITIVFYNGVGTASFTNSNTAVKWAGTVIPTLSTTVGRRDLIKLYTIDAGATWYESGRSLNIG